MTSKDTRVRLRNDVYDSLTYYIHDEKARLSGIPGVMPDAACVVNEILMNYLAEKHHYPPRNRGDTKCLN